MEHAIGTRITLEVVEGNRCNECYFYSICDPEGYEVKCFDYERKDHKNIIYKEVK